MKDIIKKIIKYFSPLTMELEVDGKKYKLVFTDCIGTLWTVRVKDLDLNKTIGCIYIYDEIIINRKLESEAAWKIRKVIQDNEIETRRKESMKYYFGK